MKDISIKISLDYKPFLTGMNNAIEVYKNFIKFTSKPLVVGVDNSGLLSSLDELKENLKTSLSQAVEVIEENTSQAMDTIEEVIEQTNANIKESAENTKQSTVKTLGEIGLAINGLKSIFSGIKNVVGPMISASNEAEKTVNDLSSALKVINQDSETYIDSYKALAQEIQKTTVIGDEHTLSLVTMAVNMGIVHEKREEAVKGAIGLAKAFENAGLSQETAMKGIALAYEGNFSALQRYIPALQSAGSDAEKMAILQEHMANGFQMAQDETNTGAGALLQFQNIIGELQESIGDMIKVALLPLVKILSEVALFLNENQVIFKMLIVSVGIFSVALAKKKIILISTNSLIALQTIKSTALAIAYKSKAVALGVVALATKIYTGAQWLLNIAISANPIGVMVAIVVAAIAVIVALTVAVVKLFKAFKKGKEEASEPIESKDKLNEELTTVKDHLAEKEKAIRESYQTEREELKKQFNDKKISQTEYLSKLRELNKNELNEIYGLHKDNFEREIALIEKKIKVGKATHDDLKKIVGEYYEWVKGIYGEDSEEYIDALQKKLDIEKEYTDKIKKLQEDLDKFRKSLRTSEQVIYDTYNEELKQQRTFLDNKLITEKEYWQNRQIIKEKYDSDLQKLELQRHKDDLALIERKLSLGMATNDELKTQLQEYENFVLQHYKTDDEAYLSLQEKKQAIHKKFTDDVKRELDELNKQWSDVVKDFQNRRIDLSQLKSEFNSIRANLTELQQSAENPIEIDVVINKFGDELNDIEDKDTTQKRTVKLEFENAQLRSEDPELARMQNSLRAIDDYYARRREMLIDAGIEEVAIDEQIAKEKGAIEEAFQIARFETISRGMGKVLGDLAKSGIVSFETAKALQIAQLLIETPAAAFAAYRSTVGIPFVGTALAPIAFATAMATGMMQIATIKKQKPPKAEKGGMLFGPSHSSGGILIEAEGNEYITNKRRVSELGKGFFDFINFAPLDQVKRVFDSIHIPDLNVPTIPKFAFSTGGYTGSGGTNLNALETKMDTLIGKIMDGFEMLDKKDYNINIKAQSNSVKYIREHNKALEEYNRRTS